MYKKRPKKNYIETFNEYKSLLKILKKRKLKKIDFYKHNQSDVILTADLIAKKINAFIKINNIKSKYKLIDIGCGLGQITNEICKINGYKNTFACEPSKYASKFVQEYYPKINFLMGGIEDISSKYNNFFDVIYLKEVSPFRSSDINLQRKLIKKLQVINTKNGIIILEQIKNKGKLDIYSNLKKLKIKYKIIPTLPNFIFKLKILQNILLNNYKLVNYILIVLDKIYFNKLKKTYYITIFKS